MCKDFPPSCPARCQPGAAIRPPVVDVLSSSWRSCPYSYDVWDIGEVHPGVVVQVRRGLVPSGTALLGQRPHHCQPAATTLRRRRTQLIEQRAQYPRRCRVLINCLGGCPRPAPQRAPPEQVRAAPGQPSRRSQPRRQPHGLTQMPQCGTRRSQPDLGRRPPRCGELPEDTRRGHGRGHQRGFGRRRIACAARQRPRAGGRLGGLREGDTKVAAANPADIAPGHPAG